MLNKLIFVIICMQLLCLSITSLPVSSCAGCSSDVSINDEIKKIADWTATQMPTQTCDYCPPDAIYSVFKITSAKTQVVSGKNYILKLIYSKSLKNEVSF